MLRTPAWPLTLVVSVVGTLALLTVPSDAEPDTGFVDPIERTHGRASYYEHAALRASFALRKGGQVVMAGTMLFDTPLGRSRMELDDGATVVFDGERAWVSPADSPHVARGRFHVLTWPYFLVLPFKLSDPGVHVEPIDPATWNGVDYDRAKMTFSPGTGDAPDDWYVLYRHPETDRLEAAAYIVTWGRPQQEAEKAPHAAVYHDHRRVAGALLPARMTIHDWNDAQGPYGEPLYEVTFGDFAFVEPPAGAFARPEGAAEARLPEGS